MTVRVRQPARKPERKKVAHRLPGFSLSKDEIRPRLEQASDPAYWQALYPPFSICAKSPQPHDLPPLDATTLAHYARGLDQYGYFSSDSPLARTLTAPLLECVEAVRKQGWPPGFAYVYDELWTLWRVAPIAQILTAALGN